MPGIKNVYILILQSRSEIFCSVFLITATKVNKSLYWLTEKSKICMEPVPQCSHIAGLIVHNILYAKPSMPVQLEDLHVHLAGIFVLQDKFTQTTGTAQAARMTWTTKEELQKLNVS